DFTIASQFTLGPKIQYATDTSHAQKVKALLYGLTFSYYTSPVTSPAGWYARTSPSVTNVWSYRTRTQASDLEGGFTVTTGHFWHWKSGFNFQLGTGFAWYTTDSGFLIESGPDASKTGAFQPVLEAEVGWEL